MFSNSDSKDQRKRLPLQVDFSGKKNKLLKKYYNSGYKNKLSKYSYTAS